MAGKAKRREAGGGRREAGGGCCRTYVVSYNDYYDYPIIFRILSTLDS